VTFYPLPRLKCIMLVSVCVQVTSHLGCIKLVSVRSSLSSMNIGVRIEFNKESTYRFNHSLFCISVTTPAFDNLILKNQVPWFRSNFPMRLASFNDVARFFEFKVYAWFDSRTARDNLARRVCFGSPSSCAIQQWE